MSHCASTYLLNGDHIVDKHVAMYVFMSHKSVLTMGFVDLGLFAAMMWLTLVLLKKKTPSAYDCNHFKLIK